MSSGREVYVAIDEDQDGEGSQWTAKEDTLGDLTRNETIESIRRAVLAQDGSRRIAGAAEGPADDAAAVGERLAARLRAGGAAELLG